MKDFYFKRALSGVLALLALGSVAVAQVPSVQSPPSGWVQATRTSDLSVTSASSSTSLGTSPGINALVYNVGVNPAYVRFGATAPTAVAATDIPVPAGGCAFLRIPVGSAFIGAITTSSTTTLKVSTGSGAPVNCASSASGGSQTVTGTVALTTQYPSGATPVGGNGAGTTGAVVGTLAGAASKTTYICGFNVQSIGGTATVGPIVVAGVVGGVSQTYQTDVNSATVGKTVASASFSPCVPASAVNTAITITTTANGTATAVDVNSWGYQL